MPRRPQQTKFNSDNRKSKKGSSFGVEFVNFTLTEREKDKFHKWQAEELRSLDEMLGELVFAEYKVSISADHENNCFVIAVTGKERSINPSLCMVSRSDDMKEAVSLALYKGRYYFPDGIWEMPEDEGQRWG